MRQYDFTILGGNKMDVTLNYYPCGKTKAITLSYDDGRIYDRKLVDLCNRYGMKATFHLNSGFFGREGYVTKEEVGQLYQGHEVSVHTLTHPFLNHISRERICQEVRQDRINLERAVNYPIHGMSYPFGAYDAEVISLLKAQGIVYSRTTLATDSFELPKDFMQWHPTCHHNHNLLENARRFLEPQRYQRMQLLYVWGHSFEFPRDNNWDVMEDFFQMVSGKEEIWFATNMEICRYVKSLKDLEFSADGSAVYNPSANSVWIGVDGRAAEVKPGRVCRLSGREKEE
jgi:peptidoglycan/xylan/chitin deacetylase (PgdA/CDA1 family)